MRNAFIRRETVSVDQEMFRTDLELVDRPMHRQERGPQDVYPIDLVGTNHANSPGQRFTLDQRAQLIAFLLAQLFTVIQGLTLKIGRQDHGRRENRPGQATAARFIASRLKATIFEIG